MNTEAMLGLLVRIPHQFGIRPLGSLRIVLPRYIQTKSKEDRKDREDILFSKPAGLMETRCRLVVYLARR